MCDTTSHQPPKKHTIHTKKRKELHDNTWKMTIILNVNKLYWVYYIDILIIIYNNINDDEENIK